jgi:hypothetical protein
MVEARCTPRSAPAYFMYAAGNAWKRPNVDVLIHHNVPVKDTTLFERMRAELPAVFLRCIARYLQCVAETGPREIWTVVPDRIRQRREESRGGIHPIVAFLNSGRVVRDDEAETPKEDFYEAFTAFCIDEDVSHVPTFESCKQHLTSNGYKPKRPNICKSCGCRSKQCRDGGCGKINRLHNSTKTPSWFIANMRLVDDARSQDA